MRHTFTEALGKHNFTEKKRKEKVGRSLKATDPPMAKMFRPLKAGGKRQRGRGNSHGLRG